MLRTWNLVQVIIRSESTPTFARSSWSSMMNKTSKTEWMIHWQWMVSCDVPFHKTSRYFYNPFHPSCCLKSNCCFECTYSGEVLRMWRCLYYSYIHWLTAVGIMRCRLHCILWWWELLWVIYLEIKQIVHLSIRHRWEWIRSNVLYHLINAVLGSSERYVYIITLTNISSHV